MLGWAKKIGRIGRNILSAASIFGGRSAQRSQSGEYYQQAPTCQISNLSFIYSFFLGKKRDGVFVEVGAYDGWMHSNTWGLARRGWSGLLIEPVPEFAKLCRNNHRNHTSVEIVQKAVSDVDEQKIDLQVGGPLSTASPSRFEEYSGLEWARKSLSDKKIAVQSLTLNSLLAEWGVEPGFDVLVVDVEGYENEVFQGFSVSRWAPKILIVELTDMHPDIELSRRQDYLLGCRLFCCGYHIVFKDSINTVLVRRDVCREAYNR